MQRNWLPIAAVAAVLVIAVVGGIAVLSGNRPAQTAAPTATTGSGVNGLTAGACLAELPSADSSVSSVLTSSCDIDHAAEVFEVFDWSGSDAAYPGDSEISDRAEGGCTDAFESYVGLPVELSMLDVYWFAPTEDSWANGDRRFICVATSIDESPLQDTIRDSEQ